MPVTWSISHEEQLVVAIAEGEVVRGDIDGYLSAMIAEGAMPYRKLFDLTFAPMALAAAALRALGKRVTDYAKGGPVGPVAIVVGSELALDMARIFEAQAQANRDLRIFRDLAQARAWLDEAAPPTSGKPIAPP